MNKREFIKKGTIGAFALIALPSFLKNLKATGNNSLIIANNLTFDAASLSEFIDAGTMEEHHLYFVEITNQLNNQLAGLKDPTIRPRYILRNSSKFNVELSSLSGDFINHRLFFRSLTTDSQEIVSTGLSENIQKDFGSIALLKSEFSSAAINLKNEGWVWLIYNDGKLKIISTAGNQNPLLSELPYEQQGFPVFGLDLFKHAYYNRYKYDVAEYVSNYWNVVDWKFINQRYQRALNSGY